MSHRRKATGQAVARALAVAGLAAMSAAPVRADCTQDAMIVFDGSGSMSEMGFNMIDEPRIFDARRAMRKAMPGVSPPRRVGLVIYGPGEADSCANVDLRFTPIPDAAGPVVAAVDALQPAGETPLTDAVRRATEVLLGKDSGGDVVLVTDGKETCEGNPCQLAATLAADAPGLRVHVIGFKVRGDRFSWGGQGANDYTDAQSVARCLADQTGGLYVSTETVDELVGALRQTLGCALLGRVEPELPPTLSSRS